jgi:hypothetical protein
MMVGMSIRLFFSGIKDDYIRKNAIVRYTSFIE